MAIEREPQDETRGDIDARWIAFAESPNAELEAFFAFRIDAQPPP